MKIVQKAWTAERVCKGRGSINLNPQWQRGPAWKLPRQVLLIDSILRGMDIPKVYLRQLSATAAYKFDAVDGQQRLRAIWMFRDDQLRLDHPEPLQKIDGHEIKGKSFSELHAHLQAKFDAFSISVALIEQGTNDEITGLFARLQMGVSLNPAELRNAMLLPMRHLISTIATSHRFFSESKIPGARYKHHDFVTHLFAMAAYQGKRDIKAPDLKHMIRDFDHARSNEALEISARVGDALNVLEQVNQLSDRKITQKWVFVDLCWLIMQRQAAGATVDSSKLSSAYLAFEKRRRDFNSQPELLIRGQRANAALDRHLYQYINAFRIQGGLKANIAARNAALKAHCPSIDMGDK